MDKPIIISYPCNDMVHADFAHCVTLLALYSAVKANLWIGVSQTRGSIICASRNYQVRQALDAPAGCSHMLFLDSDMVFPANALERLLSHKLPIVGASYCMRREPRAMTHRDLNFASHLPALGEHDRDVYRVHSLGMGCVLIHTDVFKAIRVNDPVGPFFAVEYHGEEHHSGEDTYFFKKVNQAGIPVYCDIRLSYEVAHTGMHHFRPGDVQKVYDGTEPRFELQTVPLAGLGAPIVEK